MVRMCLSLPCPLQCVYFLSCLTCQSQSLAYRILSEGTDLWTVVYAVLPWEEGNLGAPYVAISAMSSAVLISFR